MAGFDVQGARSAGYSDDEIAAFLAQSNPKFDMAGAAQAGYSPTEIVNHLGDVNSTTKEMQAPVVQMPDGYNDEDFKKSLAAGIVKGATQIAGLPVFAANALGKATHALSNKITGENTPDAPDIQTGSAQNLQDLFQKYVAPLHQSTTALGSGAETAGEVAPALVGGPEGLLAKLGTRVAAPKIATGAVDQVLPEDSPYKDLADLVAGGVAGGVSSARSHAKAVDRAEFNAGKTAPVPPLSDAGQATHDAVATAINKAGRSPDKLAAQFSKIQDNEALTSSMTPDQKAQVDTLAGSGKRPHSELANLATLSTAEALGAAAGIPGLGLPVYGATKLGRVYFDAKHNKNLFNTAERLRQDVIKNDPGPDNTPPGGAAPGPGPTGPKLPLVQPWRSPPPQPAPNPAAAAATAAQMARVNAWSKMATDLANNPDKGPAPTGPAAALLGGQSLDQVLQPPAAPAAPPAPPVDPLALPKAVTGPAAVIMNGLRKAQAMREAQPTPPVAPATPPAINPLALPRSITQPAQNLTAGYDNTQAMQTAADPLAKYSEAVKANDVMDRQGDAAQARDAAGLTSARRALEKLQAAADPGFTPEGIRARASAKIVKKDGKVTETPQAPTPEASPAEAGPQRPAEPPVEQPVVEAPVPDKGILIHTKVNGADREIAANATAEFAKTNAPQATLSRYQSSTEQKQARIRDRLLQASKDQDFQAENMDLMQHMDAIRHVRSRSALEAHITDASPETQAFLKRYFGPKWAKTVWNKK